MALTHTHTHTHTHTNTYISYLDDVGNRVVAHVDGGIRETLNHEWFVAERQGSAQAEAAAARPFLEPGHLAWVCSVCGVCMSMSVCVVYECVCSVHAYVCSEGVRVQCV
jgi:hypothetical protein